MRVRRSAAWGLITALTLAVLAVGAPAASANSSKEAQFVQKINAERSRAGKGTLSVKGDLVSVARRHSARMAKRGDIWHNDNLGNEVHGWTVLGENVGMGPTVDSLHTAFMNSEGHRRNIMLNDYNQVGVGVVVDNGTIYVTEVFARRASAEPDDSGTGGGSLDRSSDVTAQAPPAHAVAPPPVTKAPPPSPRTLQQLVRVIALDRLD